MKPARATSRGAKRSISAPSAASNASRVACARCSTTRVAMPRSRAIARPWAAASLAITALTGIPASMSACMLLPRPEISTTTKSEHPFGAIAVLGEQREHAFFAVEVQRAQRDECVAAAQMALHAERHHHAAVVDHPLRHHRLVRSDERMARDERLAQLPDRRQVALQVSLQRALRELGELRTVGKAVLEQCHLRVHRKLVEGEDLLFDALDLVVRQPPLARELEELRVERRALLGTPGTAQVEEHAPGLQLVHDFARQADRRKLLERALE